MPITIGAENLEVLRHSAFEIPKVRQMTSARLGALTFRVIETNFPLRSSDIRFRGIMLFYLDDALLLPTAEPMVVGKAALREEWQHILAIPDMQSQGALTKLEVSASGDMGYTMGTYVAHMQGEDGQPVVEPGKFLTVWKRQEDGSWRIAVDTYNTDVPPPDHK